jgi:hypothetical protein
VRTVGDSTDGHYGPRPRRVSAQRALSGIPLARYPFPRQVPALGGAFGSGRVLYGSDYCWTPGLTGQVASIDTASAGESGDNSGGPDCRAVTLGNAGRLLRRSASR